MKLPVDTLKTSEEGSIGQKKVGFISVFFMVFVYVASGAYGIEDIVSSSGPGMTMIVLVLLAIFWGTPYGLICSEMNAEYPDEGGMYVWVKETFGQFAGYLSGWWFAVMCQIDTALYLTLITGYIKIFIHLEPVAEIALIAGMALICCYINLRGIEVIGVVSTVFSLITLAPFIILIFMGFADWNQSPIIPLYNTDAGLLGSLGPALVIGIWMYSGYEAISSMSGEIEDSKNLLPKVMMAVMPFIALIFILPTLAGLASVGEWERWVAEYEPGMLTFIDVGGIVGGKPLLALFAVGAIVSQIIIYNDYIASGSRLPFVLSEDKLFPKTFVKLHKKLKTPYIAIVTMSVISAILAISGSFSSLIVIDVFLYMFALILMFAAAIKIRWTKPKREGIYRVPVSNMIYSCFAGLLIAICVTTLFTNGIGAIVGGCLGLLSGPITYLLFREMYGGYANPARFQNLMTQREKLISFAVPFYGMLMMRRQKDQKTRESAKRMAFLGFFTWVILLVVIYWAVWGNLLLLLTE